MSIKLKVFIYTFGLIILINAGFGYYTLNFQKDNLIQQKIKDISFFLQGFSIPIKDALISNDYPVIQNYIKSLRIQNPINEINIYDDTRKNVGSTNPHNINNSRKASVLSHINKVFDTKKGLHSFKKELIVVEPILEKNILYGVMEVRLKSSIITDLERAFIKKMLVFLLVSIILGGLFSYLLAGSLSQKVMILIQASKSLASGDFKNHVDIHSGDEFGVLAKIYNKMIFNMKIMFNVIKKINFSTPSEELIEVIMDNIIMALNAERSSILFYDEEEGFLKLQTVRGLEGEILDVVNISPGEGIAGKVFESGIPMIVNSGFNDPEFKKFGNSKWRDEKIKNIICVPIKVEDKIVGVINVVNKNSDNGFDEFDVKLLHALVGHISTAISKSTMYNESITDGLTGLYIKSHFYSRLEEEAFRARRYGLKLSLIIMDVDDFSKINEEYGNLQADLVLMNLGRFIKSNLRMNIDIPARYGGDSIALILPETDLKMAMLFAERLRAKIEEFTFPLEDGGTMHLTVSGGVAEYILDGELAGLVKATDDALKQSKNMGKNRVTMSEPV
ncbi:MAG: hypothetical protein C0601_12315 [Candidatus Muiribacterium halophilum]|uniref:Diguanylate cyclase n=1 Tax=Muiribacterium halophilum TaxID=2053465 RepID=A0A2N5ZAP7_MUIH1|nr:MAG: hypothetical protein C0601_12315 [Candidatus Muirbacterium halophilum]